MSAAAEVSGQLEVQVLNSKGTHSHLRHQHVEPTQRARPLLPNSFASATTALQQNTTTTTLHYARLHYTTLHCATLHYTTLHYTALHYTTLHRILLRHSQYQQTGNAPLHLCIRTKYLRYLVSPGTWYPQVPGILSYLVYNKATAQPTCAPRMLPFLSN